MLSALRDYVGDNYIQADAQAEETKLRSSFPFLLKQDEKVAFAFLGRGGSGRDSFYLTDRRILERDVKGLTGASVKYVSTPYSKVKAWAISTAGGGFDSDSELQVWASGMKHLEIEFSKKKVDLFAINQFFNSKILPQEQEVTVVIPQGVTPGSQFQTAVAGQQLTVLCPPHLGPGMTMSITVPSTNPGSYTSGPKQEETGAFLNWLGDDAKKVDPRELEARLRTDPNVLAANERIELAFKSRRDHMLLSNQRLFVLDRRGITGKKVVFLSVLWKHVRAFAVETAGSWDRDCELKLHTNIDELQVFDFDLRSATCDVMAVQRFLADRMLGMDSQPQLAFVNRLQGQPDAGAQSLFAWLGDDSRQIDAEAADQTFHADPAILQGSERVEFAFKGRRDMLLFTTKRLVSINVQGWTGRKKEYLSVPWSTVQAYGVRSAGSFLDKDAELMIWTDVMYSMKSNAGPDLSDVLDVASALGGEDLFDDNGSSGGSEAVPGMAYLEFDFQKDKVDLMAVQRYLAFRCIPTEGLPPDAPLPPSVLADMSPQGAVEKLLSWLGGDASQLDAKNLEGQLSDAKVLVEGESVAMAFKAGRDTCVFTERRLLSIDVQGFSGKRISYVSLPYASVRAFEVESAGTFDRDAELKVHTCIHWGLATLSQDFRSGRADILAIQNFLANRILRHCPTVTPGPAGSSSPWPTAVQVDAVGGIEGFLDWLGDDMREVDAGAVQRRLQQETPILEADEEVDAAFKCGRDLFAHTSKRMLSVDVKGWSGKKVSYLSVPLRFCTGFELKTAGKLDRDSELRVYTDYSEWGLSQDLRKAKVDIQRVWANIQSKLLP
eukprot:CAMPEP_0202822970 /NCGR_PEP_ID=MMETSP1389-20130828/11442_1 /ASSEMBLY_ACC=CAM_ASM_000865 /TAXON_ID=302021 /ORGANISM="Rhodomonas sp., Strain CCMP768" /LENGTH=832 /DNA_ID=CAMNT_0049495939 /DNA_START=1 /DNA_END=2499 /DNA_ORIENTATION=+